MDWVGITEWVALALVLVLLVPVVFLGVRRRWLSRQGGLFDCSVRLSSKSPGSGWALGVARYSGDNLEWFRVFSIALRPRLIFPRSQARAGAQRDPDPIESVFLYDEQRILTLELAAAERRLNAGDLDEETRQHFLRAQAQVRAAHLAQSAK